MIETNKIYHGDSVKVLAGFPAGCFDLVVTSPPYDNLRDYKGFSFNFADIAKNLTRTLKYGGVIVWNVADQTIDGSETGTSFRQALYFKDVCGLRLHDTMIYQKEGSPRPASANSVRYSQSFEYVFILSKGRPKAINLLKDKVNVSAGRVKNKGANDWRKKDGSMQGRRTTTVTGEFGYRTDIWQIRAGYVGGDSTHPAPMPEKLANDHIRSWSNEGDIVLDPFVGGGTTIAAAKKLSRKWIGIDISEEYCELARKRVSAIPPSLL